MNVNVSTKTVEYLRKRHLRLRPIPLKTNALRRNVQRNVKEYLVNSTFHGLNYVGDTKLSISERLFFVLAFILVSLLSAYYISIMWLKWTATPIIVSIDPVYTSISDIPFPAITICNMNQVRKSIAKDIKPNTFEDSQLKTICSRKDEINENYNFTSSWKQYKKFLMQVSQPCHEMLVACKFGAEPFDCFRIFETVLTDDGLCCTFNQLHPRFREKNYRAEEEFDLFEDSTDFMPVDWNPEDGYGSTILTKNMYPRVAAGPGSGLGLILVLYSNYDDYYCSSTNSAGFKLLLHNPMETPLIENFGIFIRTGHDCRLAITPQVPSASYLIRGIPQKERQCTFTSESNSTYFRSYTKKNCELECKSRYVEKQCGCVLYYMPKLNENTKICGQSDAPCYEKIKLAIDSSHNDTFNCKCMPGCFSLFYSGETSMTKFNVNGFIRDPVIRKYNSSLLRKNIAMVNIYYDDNIVRRNVKNQFVGGTDFLSGTGGLLSLFMGFSVISIIEIIYYASLRPFCVNKRLTTEINGQVVIGEPKAVWKKMLDV